MRKLKYLVAALALSATAFATTSEACPVNTFASENVRVLINAQGGWPIPESWCPILAQNPDIKVVVDSDQFIGDGRSIAYASVTLRDGFGVVAPNNQTSLRITSFVDSNSANNLQYVAISNALHNYDLQDNINWLRNRDHELIQFITKKALEKKVPGTSM